MLRKWRPGPRHPQAVVPGSTGFPGGVVGGVGHMGGAGVLPQSGCVLGAIESVLCIEAAQPGRGQVGRGRGWGGQGRSWA